MLSVRQRIVEACRTTQTAKTLSKLVFTSPCNAAKYCRSLELEGWIKIKRGNVTKIPMEFTTIRPEKYPSDKEKLEQQKNKPVNPLVRTIRMEDLKRKYPDYYDRKLKKLDGRGIPSSFYMMEG